MIVFRRIINVLPEKHKEVLQTLLSLVEPPGEGMGCLGYGIFNDIEDENVFNLIYEWETREYLNRFLRSDRFRTLLGIKSLLCAPFHFKLLKNFDLEEVRGTEFKKKNKGCNLTWSLIRQKKFAEIVTMPNANNENMLDLANTEFNRRIIQLEAKLLDQEKNGRKLQDSEKRYRRLFESAKDDILILDAASRDAFKAL